MNTLQQDLICPITLSPLEDPILLPCCGKSASRDAVITWFENSQVCPNCRENLENFNPQTTPRNLVIQNILDSMCNLDTKIEKIECDPHDWGCTLTSFHNNSNELVNAVEMSLLLKKSRFAVKPSLFILIVDRSGSMGGNPWDQVCSSMLHILSLSQSNPLIRLVIIPFGSDAWSINVNAISQEETIRQIKRINTNSGTNFFAAFDVLQSVLLSDVVVDIKNVTVVFMTDGCDGHSNQDVIEKLISTKEDFRQQYSDSSLIVHPIGFGNGCNKVLLESIRSTGTEPGIFRYAESDDNTDTLCNKIQSLFEIAAESSNVSITYKFSLEEDEKDLMLSINQNHIGKYQNFIVNLNGLPEYIYISSSLEKNLKIAINHQINDHLIDKWISKQIDTIAVEILDISKQHQENQITEDIRNLWVSLIQQKIQSMIRESTNDQNYSKLEYIDKELELLKTGVSINIGKMYDLRDASKFDTFDIALKPKQKSANNYQTVQSQINPVTQAIEETSHNKEYPVRYSRNNEGKDRNKLQEFITDSLFNTISSQNIVDKYIESDITYIDKDGNNAIMLAAYCGHSEILKVLLKNTKGCNINKCNHKGESAMSLAIKGRGFYKCMKLLMQYDALVDEDRKKGLEEFAIDRGFTVAAKMISQMSADQTSINLKMTDDYVKFVYENLKEKILEFPSDSRFDFDVQEFLRVAVAKKLVDMVKELLSVYNAQPDFNMVYLFCFPPKADDPNVDSYIELTKFLIEANPKIINEVTDNNETLLYRACEKGNLPQVKYYLDLGIDMEIANNLGNTPLWFSCSKRYPCIVEELVNRGANVNHQNLKGNSVLYPICQKGPLKIAQFLVENGCDVSQRNGNGDTLLLSACRNGQADVVDFILPLCDEELIEFAPEIDGFNTIFAAVESDRVDVVDVLINFGIKINQYTKDDNPILKRATPLHLAAYYDRQQASKKLLFLGVDKNALDINGQTALHIAVIQGNVNIVQLLIYNQVDTSIIDNNGCTAVDFCREKNTDILKLMINPVLKPLMKFAEGFFTINDEKLACDLLNTASNVVGCLTKSQAVSITDSDGSTPLIKAVFNSNFNVCKTLLNLMSCDPKNKNGINAATLATFIGNPRIKKLFEGNSQVNQEQLQTWKEQMNISKFNKSVLSILIKPKFINIPSNTSGSMERMKLFTTVFKQQLKLTYNEIPTIFSTDIFNQMNTMLNLENDVMNSYVWASKIFTIGMINEYSTISPAQIFSLNLYLNNPYISSYLSSKLNEKDGDKLFREYINLLHSAIASLNSFQGETFIGTDQVNRELFIKGSKHTTNSFTSSTTSWRNAIENVPEFTSNSKKKGTIFIIESKNGKLVNNFSTFKTDSEVLFLPHTSFTVKNWYYGDIIALGQSNIREYKYEVKDGEIEQIKTSSASLIIHLIEM